MAAPARKFRIQCSGHSWWRLGLIQNFLVEIKFLTWPESDMGSPWPNALAVRSLETLYGTLP
jgi:hypothetical protein